MSATERRPPSLQASPDAEPPDGHGAGAQLQTSGRGRFEAGRLDDALEPVIQRVRSSTSSQDTPIRSGRCDDWSNSSLETSTSRHKITVETQAAVTLSGLRSPGRQAGGGVEFVGEQLQGACHPRAVRPVQGDGDCGGGVVNLPAEVGDEVHSLPERAGKGMGARLVSLRRLDSARARHHTRATLWDYGLRVAGQDVRDGYKYGALADLVRLAGTAAGAVASVAGPLGGRRR